MYTKIYGNSIVASDALSLIKIIENLISNNQASVDWQAITDIIDLTVSKLSLTSECIEFSNTLLSLWNSCVR